MRVFKLRETRGLKNEEEVEGQIVLEKKGGALTVFTHRPPGHGKVSVPKSGCSCISDLARLSCPSLHPHGCL